ncbi:hypothetical protein DMB42_10575 [Nonomuraea sp. WAC 01424]|uniref:DUF6153 family protein n=1 Tax=Nonomuraea sp. WAC 01424 TaxID=2203200 RepID=UPI000F792DAD|nr:DUF6153 family protein [Nonomuraea sp. WAC 01424]RSN12630.1 hypothetical protein DMB42_10575 [Nonomuraea sp. WAC 01424]
MGVVRRFVRGLLLVLLALGVCGMHTLGHLDGRHGGSPGRHGTVAQEAPAVLPAGAQAVAGEHRMPGFDPTSVCLAVLTSLLIILLAAVRFWTRRRAGAGAGDLPPARPVARPPPRPTSLRLASLSTLRI